jgi:hypothetical protein
MSSSIFIGAEQGEISTSNQRLINQSHLSYVCPEFIPQLVVPSKAALRQSEELDGFPMQKIKGPTWNKVIEEYDDIPLEVHIRIARESAKQLDTLVKEYGVILIDRHTDNIRLTPTVQDTGITFDGRNWKVYQVDFNMIRDAQEDRDYLAQDIDLSSRKGHVRFKNPQAARRAIATTAGTLVENVMAVVNQKQAFHSFRDDSEEEVGARIDKAVHDLNEKWSRGENIDMNFSQVVQFFDSLLQRKGKRRS